jgi:hypothetical protein
MIVIVLTRLNNIFIIPYIVGTAYLQFSLTNKLGDKFTAYLHQLEVEAL